MYQFSTSVYSVHYDMRGTQEKGQVTSIEDGKCILTSFTSPDFPLSPFSLSVGKYVWIWEVEKRVEVSF